MKQIVTNDVYSVGFRSSTVLL